MKQIIFGMGNEAITEGALAAGARFYAGYPITPSSEIAELSSIRLPRLGGMYVQMEDEIGSIAAIIGASVAGVKSYTATSGPGFSLMQENLGVAVMGEIPCVIINVQRSGPSTGLATKPAQGDVMQAQWGTHGDHGIIALSPSSVQECYDLTVRAFNLAERYRTPVILLADEIVGHMREGYQIRELLPHDIIDRKKPTCPPRDYQPYDFSGEEDEIAPLAPYGSEYITRINGSGHDESGDACGRPDNAAKFNSHYLNKFRINQKDIIETKSFDLEDAEYAIITFGCSVRSGKAALKLARQKGIKAGLLQLVTIWPFPTDQVREVCSRVKGVVVPEMNLGQVLGEVSKTNPGQIPIVGVNRVDGQMITPYEILAKLEEVAK
ncbi:MAG: 2-oxoacid:acceptor oxidoreductase subunit alpha [Clostridiales bacterium]|jgi:2-oxoglutarate ferredoxin oxidoreductase subunit alpha|nr:2-oxoacid:acceptor oxidoreductase subunit alpha [Clostridiales bacterium]